MFCVASVVNRSGTKHMLFINWVSLSDSETTQMPITRVTPTTVHMFSTWVAHVTIQILSPGLATIDVPLLAIEIAPACVQLPGGTNMYTPRSIQQQLRCFLHRTRFSRGVEMREDKSSCNMTSEMLNNVQTLH